MFQRGKFSLLLCMIVTCVGCITAEIEIEDLVPQKMHDGALVHQNENDEHRSLQLLPSCNNYQYTVEIRDDLRMSYVVTDDRIKVELEYDGEAWIGLGTNPNRDGKMVGAEAWIALPAIASRPAIYNLNSKRLQGVDSATDQTLENGLVSQTEGVTVMQLDKLLSDGDNVAINGNGDVVFIWAIGRSNTLGKHVRRGAFRINLDPCTVPSLTTEEVELDAVCGFLSLSIFCPLTRCGVFGRVIGLC